MKYKANSHFRKPNFITAHFYPELKESSQVGWTFLDDVEYVKSFNCVGVFKIKYK